MKNLEIAEVRRKAIVICEFGALEVNKWLRASVSTREGRLA